MADLKVNRTKPEKREFDSWSDDEPESVLRGWQGLSKPVLLGLPCARCKAYYESELKACPICSCPERVSSMAAQVTVQTRSRAA